MTLHEDIFAALSGGSPSLRVFPDILPQRGDPEAILPALVFLISAGYDDFHLQANSGLVVRLVQVDAWAGTRLSAESLMLQARERMVASRRFQCTATDLITNIETYETDTERYRISREFTVWAQE